MPRNRTARFAVLGSPVPRSRPPAVVLPQRHRPPAADRGGCCSCCSRSSLITVYFREPADGGLHGVQGAGATVLRPFEVGAERVARPFRDAYGWFEGLVAREVRERGAAGRGRRAAAAGDPERERGRSENGDLQAPAASTSAGAQLPARLRRRRDRGRSRGRRASSSSRSAIAAGSSNGIRLNDPVVTADGLVGTRHEGRRQRGAGDAAHRPDSAVSAVDLDHRGGRHRRPRRRAGDTLVLDRVDEATRSSNDGDEIVTAGWQVRRARLALPARDPDRLRQRRRRRATSTSTGRSQVAPCVDFASLALRARADPRSAERRDARCSSRPRSALLVFVAAILQVTIFSDVDVLGGTPDLLLADARRDRAPARLDLRRRRRLLRRAARRHREPRHARRHLAAAHARRLLDRPLRRDDRPRPRACAVPLGRRRDDARRSSARCSLHFMLGEPASRRGSCCSTRSGRRSLLNLLLTLPVYALCRAPARPLAATPERAHGGAAPWLAPRRERRSRLEPLPAARPARRGAVPLTPQLALRIGDPRRRRARRLRASSSSGSGRCRCSPGTQYLQRGADNQLRTVRVEAPRGPILDRNGHADRRERRRARPSRSGRPTCRSLARRGCAS